MQLHMSQKLPTKWKTLQQHYGTQSLFRTGKTDKFHYGSCETTFKLRYNNHNQSLKTQKKLFPLNYQNQ